MDNDLPHVAKHLQTGGYQTAIVGKWHLGEGKLHEPKGFNFWSVLPGQGEYFDPFMIEMGTEREEFGYVTDIITSKCINWLNSRDESKPFFLMCHHKAPHREWEPHPKNRNLFGEDIKVPETFDDNYKNRAKAAAEAKMRIKDDMKYADLGLAQPEGGSEVGERVRPEMSHRKIPNPDDVSKLRLIDKDSGEVFTFKSKEELGQFKYQRYIKRYLRTIASIDESVGVLLDYLDDNELTENTLVIYTSDQGFFLGEHGWFDKRFMYEESSRMPFVIRYPGKIKPKTVNEDIITNIDFAPTLLDIANIKIPSSVQGKSFLRNLTSKKSKKWRQSMYYHYYEYPYYHHVQPHYGIRTERYKLIHFYYDIDQWELYDLQSDPNELNNLINNDKYADIISNLKSELYNLKKNYGNNLSLEELRFISDNDFGGLESNKGKK